MQKRPYHPKPWELEVVVGWVDPRNNPTKLLNQRAGFTLRRITPAGLEEWTIMLDLSFREESPAEAG